MDRIVRLSRPKLWRSLLLALAMLLSLGTVALWNWYVLDQREQRESHRRFELDVKVMGQSLQSHMRSYEMVLRGVSAAFFGEAPNLNYADWIEIIEQLRIQELYSGITSVVWSRFVPESQVQHFLQRVHHNGRSDYRIFPEGRRPHYLPIEYIGPISPRASRLLGLDLLTQPRQKAAISQAIDSGQTQLSEPMPDLYELSPEGNRQTGALMFFPVYRSGVAPETLEQRRSDFLGMTNAAFRGQILAENVFGEQLSLFHIVLRHVPSGIALFDSKDWRPFTTPEGWQSDFQSRYELPLHGSPWQLEITATPEYERGLSAGRSNLFTLMLGGCVAVLLAILTGYFFYQHEYQLHLREQITQRLREDSEQLMLANRYKTEFLANMSHELRTPLNSILILSDQLRQNAQGNLSEKQTRHADILYRAGSDLLQLINDVLDLAKIEAGHMQINLEPTSVQDVLVDMDAAMRPQAEAKGLSLSLAADTDVPRRIYTDHIRLHQILRNLLSNAIKFTDSGRVQLFVSVEKTLPDGRSLLNFSVQDSGIGIDTTQHEQVFQAFAQVDGSTRRRFGGTGLGLAITRQLVQALGGEIRLSSAAGQGSLFSVCLPVQSVPALPDAPVAEVQRSGEGAPLLIVEDDSNFAAIIIEKAKQHGFACVYCSTGLQALELLRSEPFVAVILDILLPDISGWQLFRRLRAIPGYSHTPVHIISCLPEAEAESIGLREDQDAHYLTKPIDNQTLSRIFANLEPSAKPLQGQRLLLVEDMESEREHYQSQLAKLGFAVTAVENAAAACEAWRQERFSVLVVDLNLPDRDGFSLLDSLNQIHSLQDTRVIVNTGMDVVQQGLQQLHNYSAVAVRKQGADTTMLSQAVQGFLGQVNKKNGQKAPQNTTAAPANLQGQRLLLVDDDVRNVYAMSALLDELGVLISTAGNGEEAIAQVKGASFDLILMDMSMPVMDGYTATHLLKTEHGCRIPIIALTAHAMKGDREKCLAAGADDYLAKPVKQEELKAMLELWLRPQPRAGR